MTSTASLVRTGEPSTEPSVALTESRKQLQLLRPIAEPGEIIKVQNETRAFVHAALKPGRDFGTIPGTNKPTLYKPGAERVANGFGCTYGEPLIVDSEIDHDREVKWQRKNKSGVSYGLYRYVLKVPVIELSSGRTVGWGAGAASTMESKYVDRPRDMENTVFKMAAKRARIDACLTTFGLSEEFTQDLEDTATEREEEGEPEELAPRPMTREQAEEMPFPWVNHKVYGGKPLREIPADKLILARDWVRKKMNTDEITVDRLTMVKAMDLIIAARERGDIPEPPKKEGEQRTDPTEERGGEPYVAPLTPTTHAEPHEPPPAKGAPDSVFALTRELRTLLDDPRVPTSLRSELRRELVRKNGPGQSPAWLAQQIDDLRALLPPLNKKD